MVRRPTFPGADLSVSGDEPVWLPEGRGRRKPGWLPEGRGRRFPGNGCPRGVEEESPRIFPEIGLVRSLVMKVYLSRERNFPEMGLMRRLVMNVPKAM